MKDILAPETDCPRTAPYPFTHRECGHRLIYSMLVAGKNSKFARAKLNALFSDPFDAADDPFIDVVPHWIEKGELGERLRKAKTGNYKKMETALTEIAWAIFEGVFHLKDCTPQDLERIPGIGPKTSRFYILWTRPDARYAALDVHVLRWMFELGYEVPPDFRTPRSKTTYEALEECFVHEADQMGLTPRELDLQIWLDGSGDTSWSLD